MQAKPEWKPEATLPHNPRDFKTPNYGLNTFGDLFTPRQLVTLTTFSDFVDKAGALVQVHSNGNKAYSEAIQTYLALAVDKAIDRNTVLCTWEAGMDRMGHTFTRQALPMIWDYVETNPFANAGGDLQGTVQSLCEVLNKIETGVPGSVQQLDATAISKDHIQSLISTDPPY